jgi:hypothetical protein
MSSRSTNSQSTQVMFGAYWDHTVHLPPTRFVSSMVEQDLEHYVRNKLLDVEAYFIDFGRMEAEVKLSACK